MTLRDFRRAAIEITSEEFNAVCIHPLEHGIARARFRQDQLKRLIEMGRKAKFQTAKRQVAAWQRELVRLEGVQTRLANTKAGVFPRRNPDRRSRPKRVSSMGVGVEAVVAS